MIYLILAILTSTTILVVFKLLPRYQIHLPQAITLNYLTAATLGYLSIAGDFRVADIPGKPWFAFSLLTGLGLIAGFYTFGMSTRKVGVALTSVASKMSVVIPVLLGFIVFHDPMGISRVGGVVLALLAFYFTLYRKGSRAAGLAVLIFPILLFLINGANDSLFKMAEAWFIGDDFVLFLATAFLVALFLGLAFSFWPGKQREGLKSRHVVAGIVLGLLNWYSTLAVLKGLSVFDVSVFYPVYNAGVVGLSTLIGAFYFKEKLSNLNWAGVGLALLAILVIATR